MPRELENARRVNMYLEQLAANPKQSRRSFVRTKVPNIRSPVFSYVSFSYYYPPPPKVRSRDVTRRGHKASNKGKGSEKLRSLDKVDNPKFLLWKPVDSLIYCGSNYTGKSVDEVLDELYVDDVDDVDDEDELDLL